MGTEQCTPGVYFLRLLPMGLRAMLGSHEQAGKLVSFMCRRKKLLGSASTSPILQGKSFVGAPVPFRAFQWVKPQASKVQGVEQMSPLGFPQDGRRAGAGPSMLPPWVVSSEKASREGQRMHAQVSWAEGPSAPSGGLQ